MLLYTEQNANSAYSTVLRIFGICEIYYMLSLEKLKIEASPAICIVDGGV